jgi:hypothetical protein
VTPSAAHELGNSMFVNDAKSPLTAGCAFGRVCKVKSLIGANPGSSALIVGS